MKPNCLLQAREADAEARLKREATIQPTLKRERQDDSDGDEVTFVSKRTRNERRMPRANEVIVLD